VEKTFNEYGELLLEQLKKILENSRDFRELTGGGLYRAFLHGQVMGLVLALKIMFPGDGALGEQASQLAAVSLGEDECGCHHYDIDEASPGE